MDDLQTIKSIVHYFGLGLTILFFIGFGLVYLLIKNYLSNYLNEKGKNLAEKEDIQKLTTLVEEVKNKFIKETEHLKANLNILSNTQLNLINEERNSIVDFNKYYFEWYNTKMRLPNVRSIFDNDELDEVNFKLESKYDKMINSSTIFKLFVDDNDLKVLMSKLIEQTIKTISEKLIEYNTMVKMNNIKISNLKTKPNPIDFNIKFGELISERKKFTKKFRDEMIKMYAEMLPNQTIFIEKCREYLYKLLNPQES